MIILPRLFILLGTIALLAGCSSGDPSDQDDNFFSGPFDATVSGTFPAAGGTTVQSDYDVRLDLGEPDPNDTRFEGTLRIERAASAAGPRAVGTADVFGFVTAGSSGTEISLRTDPQGTGQGFEWAIGGDGTLSSDGRMIDLPQAQVGDPLLGNSNELSITLR